MAPSPPASAASLGPRPPAHAVLIPPAILTGIIGLVCLGSIVVRHPIGLMVLRRSQTAAPEAALRHAAVWITAIAGVTLVVHAAVIMTLAAALPTATFIAVHQLVGLGILAFGVLALVGRKRFLPAPPADPAPPARDGHPAPAGDASSPVGDNLPSAAGDDPGK